MHACLRRWRCRIGFVVLVRALRVRPYAVFDIKLGSSAMPAVRTKAGVKEMDHK